MFTIHTDDEGHYNPTPRTARRVYRGYSIAATDDAIRADFHAGWGFYPTEIKRTASATLAGPLPLDAAGEPLPRADGAAFPVPPPEDDDPPPAPKKARRPRKQPEPTAARAIIAALDHAARPTCDACDCADPTAAPGLADSCPCPCHRTPDEAHATIPEAHQTPPQQPNPQQPQPAPTPEPLPIIVQTDAGPQYAMPLDEGTGRQIRLL